jgi:CubicO group peptidase (beta-lactamase class C family)
MTKLTWILAVIALVAKSAAAQSPLDLKVDQWVDSARRARKIPGVSIAVIRDGKVVHAKGYGLANVEHDVAATEETVYQSGSVGKQFTATLVMMLIADGKLALDDPIRKFLPDAPRTWDKITIRRLLSHTAGLGDYPNDFDLRRDYTEAELLKMVYRSRLLFPSGTGWSYSNLGYLTLGVLIHKISGQFYGDLLAERIFKPLGMGTKIISEADIVPHRSAGYRLVDGGLKNQEWVSPTLNTTADGALYFTVLDLAKWDAALYTETLLRKTDLELMWTPIKLVDGKTHNYGFGWAISTANGHRLIEHGGGWQGFLTHIARYVDDRLTVVVLCNLAARDSNPNDIAHHVAAMYLPALAPKEASKRP